MPNDSDVWTFGEVLADGQGWEVNSTWRVINSRAEPVEVVLRPFPPRAILADEVRRLPLGTVLAESRRQLVEMARDSDRMHAIAPSLPAVPDGFVSSGPQRGRRLGDDELHAVAAVYREAHGAGEPVNEAVREAFTLSKDGAAKRIMAARRAGLLNDVEPKRGGGMR
jgi:hypothetical protein